MWVFIPEGLLAISLGSRSAPGVAVPSHSADPEGGRSAQGWTTVGVEIDIGSLTGGALRDPRLIADSHPRWFAQQDLGFNPHETVMGHLKVLKS